MLGKENVSKNSIHQNKPPVGENIQLNKTYYNIIKTDYFLSD